MAVGVGDQIAPLIGAGTGEISLHQNVTLTQAVISSCFDFRGPRNKVVMVELEFPSTQYFYHEQRRLGARVEVVATQDHIRIDLDKLLAAIDESTLLVPISQVLFRSSCIVDARAIIERAHRVGAHVILDVFQAAGAIPITCAAWALIFRWAESSSGFVADRVSPTCTSARTCAPSCARRSQGGLRTAVHSLSKPAPSMRATTPSAI